MGSGSTRSIGADTTGETCSPDDATQREAEHRAHVEQLFATTYAELVGLAGLVLADRSGAEDVVQDAFAALYRRAPLDDPDAAVGYLRRSVVNGARDRLRRRRVEERSHPLRVVVSGPSVEERTVAEADARAVAVALARLPLRQRECVAWHHLAGLTHGEVAAVLGISAGAVKVHLHRATRRLTTLLEDHR